MSEPNEHTTILVVLSCDKSATLWYRSYVGSSEVAWHRSNIQTEQIFPYQSTHCSYRLIHHRP